MKNGLITIAAGLLLTGCSNASERAWGAPLTDITATSTETYARARPYAVLDSRREAARLVLDVNVTDIGHADSIARTAIADLRDGASDVVVNVYDAVSKPPDPMWGRVEWRSNGDVIVMRAAAR